MTLHLIDSSPLAALGLVSLNPLQGALWEMGGTPDEQMQLVQQSDQPSTLIKVSNGDQRAILELDLDGSPIVVDNTVSGVGGIDTGVVAADTVYDLRVISNLAGDDYGAIATVSGNAYTPQAGYPWVSPVIGAMVTDGSEDNLVLVNRSQRVFMYDSDPLVLSAGTATIVTVIDLSAFIPFGATTIDFKCVNILNNNPETDWAFRWGTGVGQIYWEQRDLGNQIGDIINQGDSFTVQTRSEDPATMVYYNFTVGTAGRQSYVNTLGFELPRV